MAAAIRALIFIAPFLMLSATSVAATQNFSCPLLKLPSGKQFTAHSISFFDGPPIEMAELASDNADTNSRDSYYWSFSGQEAAV